MTTWQDRNVNKWRPSKHSFIMHLSRSGSILSKHRETDMASHSDCQLRTKGAATNSPANNEPSTRAQHAYQRHAYQEHAYQEYACKERAFQEHADQKHAHQCYLEQRQNVTTILKTSGQYSLLCSNKAPSTIGEIQPASAQSHRHRQSTGKKLCPIQPRTARHEPAHCNGATSNCTTIIIQSLPTLYDNGNSRHPGGAAAVGSRKLRTSFPNSILYQQLTLPST